MKKCPYCAEEIQDEAIYCRWCKRELPKMVIINNNILENQGPHLTINNLETTEPQYASFWIRLLAYMLDWIVCLIIIAIFLVISGVYGFVFFKNFSTDPYMASGMAMRQSLSISWIGIVLYFCISETSKYQATIGKRLCKIRITDMNGRKISFWTSFGRFFMKCFSIGLLGFGTLFIFWSKKKQALHDLHSTLVIRA